MGICVGIDVGSVALKLAVTGSAEDSESIQKLCDLNGHFWLWSGKSGRDEIVAALSECIRITRSPAAILQDLLEEVYRKIPEQEITRFAITGSNCQGLADFLGLEPSRDGAFVARVVQMFCPQARTVFEIGGRAFNFLPLNGEKNEKERRRKKRGGGGCEEGIGFFLEQQADRMGLSLDEMGEAACRAAQAPRISRGCSVFIKSDMIHSQQKGYKPDEVLRALCESVAIKFRTNAVKGKPVETPVAFVGGVSQNMGVVRALKQTFSLSDDDIIIPPFYAWCGAIGAAMGAAMGAATGAAMGAAAEAGRGRTEKGTAVTPALLRMYTPPKRRDAPISPLSFENVQFLNDRVPEEPDLSSGQFSAYMGIDIGSVSTKFSLLDQEGRLLYAIYRPTAGQPVEAVRGGMDEILAKFGDRLEILGVGTTGSGRELIAEIIGADAINDEITAHKEGAVHVSRVLGVEPPDTIFEIGGQDSKYISIEEGAVVDFAMNEACAAGTGSFLAEQAENLHINIRDEFARLAMEAPSPSHLGEFCTVIITRSLISLMHDGESVSNLVAGLALAVARNYLNLVVRRRPIGKVVYFQGGTASNRAVAAAFGAMLGRRIIVPPYNGVIGAMGAAVLARETLRESLRTTRFRGLRQEKLQMSSRNFTCRGCSNFCDVKEMTVDGRKSYWGNRCADRYSSPVVSSRKPVIPDLIELREKLFRKIAATGLEEGRMTIGLPRALHLFDLFPFWHTFFTELGMRVVMSPPSDSGIVESGQEIVEGNFCHPIDVAFGHVRHLAGADVDYILLPGADSVGLQNGACGSGGECARSCIWLRMLPDFMRMTTGLADASEKFLAPSLSLGLGLEAVQTELFRGVQKLGISKEESDTAAEKALMAQRKFQETLQDAGREALDILKETGEHGLVLVGRSYTIYDRNINCDVPRKLRTRYGANVIPYDFLPTVEAAGGNTAISGWEAAQRIRNAAHLTAGQENLHMIYNCSFPCGPDAEIKPLARRIADKPLLFLQFDGNGYDAGYMTRCEAFLASKGLLRTIVADDAAEEVLL